MALSKITLKLGKKTIELTQEQFEELKQDMRILDKQHNYYWNTYPWNHPYYNGIRTYTGGSITSDNTSAVPTTLIGMDYNTSTGITNQSFSNAEPPPSFTGTVLSTE